MHRAIDEQLDVIDKAEQTSRYGSAEVPRPLVDDDGARFGADRGQDPMHGGRRGIVEGNGGHAVVDPLGVTGRDTVRRGGTGAKMSRVEAGGRRRTTTGRGDGQHQDEEKERAHRR
jgi:hypothetical protein